MLSLRLLRYLDSISEIKSKHPQLSKISIRLKLLTQALRGIFKRQNNLISPIKTDVLFIHSIDLMNKLGRKKTLISNIRQSGLIVTEIYPKGSKQIAQSNERFGTSIEKLYFRNFDLHAQYIIKKYSPKVIVTDRNGDLCSPFLKQHLQRHGKVIHLPHSVLTAESNKYSMIDYDFYCLYGKSSLEHLQSLNNKFGNCEVILAGSYLFDHDFFLPKATPNLKILLLGMGPAMEEDPSYFRYYEILSEWFIRNPSFSLDVRLHPRSQHRFWLELSNKYKNINVRPTNESFQKSCIDSYMCVTTYTNAVVDAALLGRPSLLFCGTEIDDHLQIEKYFSARVSNIDNLDSTIKNYKTNLGHFQRQASNFAKYHVEKEQQSVETISNIIINLANNKEINDTENLRGEF